MSIRKILGITSIRSDYDLLSRVFKEIQNHQNMEIGLIVSGAHLTQTFGYTIKHIEADKIPIIARIENLLDSNTPSSRIKSASILLQSCIHTVEAFQPDVILYGGDREDALIAATVGAYLKIPTIHFFGGDHASDGNIDNAVRHAISKLSSLHFVAHESHVQRLKALGESSNRIFFIGSPAIDNIVHEHHIQKEEILKNFKKSNWDKYALMIFHPILGHEEKSGVYFEEILKSLKQKSINAFVSYPNTDAGSRNILAVIERYQKDPNFHFYKNLDRRLFINLMRHATFMIGNSSAGIYEAPSIPIGVVNVGERQRGRYAADNVIFVNSDKKAILEGIEEVISSKFVNKLKSIESPYGNGDSTDKSLKLIKSIDFKKYQVKHEDPLI